MVELLRIENIDKNKLGTITFRCKKDTDKKLGTEEPYELFGVSDGSKLWSWMFDGCGKVIKGWGKTKSRNWARETTIQEMKKDAECFLRIRVCGAGR